MVVTRQPDLERLVRDLATQPSIPLDCEFHSEATYHPRLCLVQVGCGPDAMALDPFVLDLTPLAAVLSDPAIQKVVHAGETDLRLLARATGRPVQNVFDTQVAAAFVGPDAAPSYATLVERYAGAVLSKASQYTDWTLRPLSREQVAYALNDVRHLPAVAAALHERLSALGRLGWAADETLRRVAKAQSPRDRSRLYHKLGPLKDFSSRQLAVLREVAAWRDRRAEQQDVPVGRVVQDRALRQLAFDLPRTRRDLEGLRGFPRLDGGIDGLLDAIARALALPDDQCPPVLSPRGVDERLDPVAQLLATAARVRALDLDLAPSMLATRDDLECVARWHLAGRPDPRPDLLDPATWQRAAIGDLLLDLLDGRAGLRVDLSAPAGVVIGG